MDIFRVLLSNAVVVFVTAPLRRVRHLITVEDDLIEEGILPPQGFGGVGGCVRFLYEAGGRSYAIFYQGAVLEAALCFVKYELQRTIAIPISRRVHLDMRHAYLATTLLHTTLTYVTVTPVQTAVDTIVVNGVTDFAPATPEPEQKAAEEETPRRGEGNVSASNFTLPSVRQRFVGVWATTKYLAHHFPVMSMVSRLFLLEFGCRYASSLANNTILGYLIRFVEQRRRGGELTSFQRFVMYAGCPLLASLAVNLLTYPLATYPIAHFLRMRYYERRSAEAWRRDSEAERDYPATTTTTTTAAAAARTHPSGGAPSQQDGNDGRSSHGAARPQAGKTSAGGGDDRGREEARSAATSAQPRVSLFGEERFWWEELLRRGLHPDVRDYLWTAMYGRPEPSMTVFGSLAVTPAQTAPATARTSIVAGTALGSSGSGGGGRRGIARLYRGYGVIVASTLVSAGLAMAVNSLTSRVLSEVVHH
ncbi:hypothetical protein NESM_000230800 [Novymonas esmeraldas]|uniref:Mitochondrial carrier protein n=1 Tax=Novymonas esmeraldas TaxID=1808958 RepID=A0AAW0FAD8_9TRYP